MPCRSCCARNAFLVHYVVGGQVVDLQLQLMQMCAPNNHVPHMRNNAATTRIANALQIRDRCNVHNICANLLGCVCPNWQVEYPDGSVEPGEPCGVAGAGCSTLVLMC
jgi:hypothetical protein